LNLLPVAILVLRLGPCAHEAAALPLPRQRELCGVGRRRPLLALVGEEAS
jgi:hypothetical protein